jgi:hypothetical protein
MSKDTAIVRREPQLELTHDGKGNDRTIARGAGGRFAEKNKAAIRKNISDVIKFFEGQAVDPETGKPLDKSRHEMILSHIYDTMLSAGSEELVGLAKAYAELQRSAFGSRGKDRLLEASDPDNNRVKVILVQPPVLITDVPKPEIKVPSRPSWIDAEIISTNPQKEPNAKG